MEDEEKESQTPVVEISPLGKWKRVLLFLADFFLVFIIAITLFNLGAYPIGKGITGYSGRASESSLHQKNRDSVLYNSHVLLSSLPTFREATDFTSNLEYTFQSFVYYHLQGAAHNDKYESQKADVLYNYHVTLRGDAASYKSLIRDLDQDGFFEVGETVTLKPTYIEEFKHAFITGDELSKQGVKDYETLQNKVFLKGFNRVLDDIMGKDLVYGGVSYRQEQEYVSAFIQYEKVLIIVCASIAYLLACLIIALIIPFISKERKTLGMIFLRDVRLDGEKLILPKKKHIPLFFLYQLIINMACLFFIPLGAYDFVSLFSLPALFPISAIGALYLVLSLIFLLFEPFNRTLADRLTGTVMVTEDMLDAIYRAKGYGI